MPSGSHENRSAPVLLDLIRPRVIDYREGGVGSFIVDCGRKGNGRRHSFRQLADAVECAKRLNNQGEQLGNAVLNFSHKELVMGTECDELLAPVDKTIRDATR